MEKNRIVYSETQIFWLIIAPLLTVLAFMGIAYAYQLGTKPASLPMFLALSVPFLAALIGFYKMTITVDKSRMTVSFGIGIVKKSIAIADIDQNGIKKATIPWHYGMGIRLLANGTIVYNTKPGSGIELPLVAKTYIIGTNNYEEMERALSPQPSKGDSNL